MWQSGELTQAPPGSLQRAWNCMVEASGWPLDPPSETALVWGWQLQEQPS